MSDASVPRGASSRVAVKIRLHPDVLERLKYWAGKTDLSMNEYAAQAVEEKIARENLDYDLPSLEIQRLNQLTDELKALSSNVTNLETVLVNGFDSLLGLTRGDSYLQDEEDGELDPGLPPAIGIDADVVRDGFGGDGW